MHLLDLVQELSEEQESWLLGAPDHVRRVYNRGQQTTQLHLLALTWLLDLLQFPGRRQLVTELFLGLPSVRTLVAWHRVGTQVRLQVLTTVGTVGLLDSEQGTCSRGGDVSPS